ncbi:hypothetical protein B0H11DRAFT_2208977 [Mycena galericulata]|nr:hypothetical protein B0H11DRAFT_2208977 [Mycena galericulata]
MLSASRSDGFAVGCRKLLNPSTLYPLYIEEVVEERTWLFCWHAAIDGVMADPQAIGIHAASRRSVNGPNAYATKVETTRNFPYQALRLKLTNIYRLPKNERFPGPDNKTKESGITASGPPFG